MTDISLKLPLQVIVLSGGVTVEALRTKGDVKKGNFYTPIMVRADGQLALVGRAPGEWYPMDMFCATVGDSGAKNDA